MRAHNLRSYKTTCPACKENNFYVTPVNGFSYCFNPSCHYKEYNGVAHARKQKVRSENVSEIRLFYKEIARYYHSSLDTKAIHFLHKRGFTDQTIQDRMIGYCPVGSLPLYKKPIAKEAGLADARNNAFLGNRIVFPYFKDKGVITDIRGRSLDPNEERKYLSPFGDTYFRGAIYPYNYDLRNAKKVLLTEGEIKADIAYQIGLPCIAIPGIGAWRAGFTQEDQEFVIVFDSESKPHIRREVIAAIKKVAQYITEPKIATLPLFGNVKAEIDTFILTYGESMFRSIIDQALDYDTWQALQTF